MGFADASVLVRADTVLDRGERRVNPRTGALEEMAPEGGHLL